MNDTRTAMRLDWLASELRWLDNEMGSEALSQALAERGINLNAEPTFPPTRGEWREGQESYGQPM